MWAIQNFFKDFQNRNNAEIFKAFYGQIIPKVSLNFVISLLLDATVIIVSGICYVK